MIAEEPFSRNSQGETQQPSKQHRPVFWKSSAVYWLIFLLTIVLNLNPIPLSWVVIYAFLVVCWFAVKGLLAVGTWLVTPPPATPPQPKRSTIPPQAPLPAPPRREELAAGARQRYQATLAMLENASLSEGEMRAAQLRAKQVYLRELDGFMQ